MRQLLLYLLSLSLMFGGIEVTFAEETVTETSDDQTIESVDVSENGSNEMNKMESEQNSETDNEAEIDEESVIDELSADHIETVDEEISDAVPESEIIPDDSEEDTITVNYDKESLDNEQSDEIETEASDEESEETAVFQASSDTSYYDYFEYTDSNNNTWLCTHKTDDEAAIYGVENGDVELVIPEYVAYGDRLIKVREVIGYPGTNSTFSYKPKYDPELELYSISFPDSVVKIGSYAFGAIYNESSKYKYLNAIELPWNPNLVIGEYAFNGCLSLRDVTFRAPLSGTVPQLEYIEKYAFRNCVNLKRIELPPGSIKKPESNMDSTAFDGCYNLEEIINCGSGLDMDCYGADSALRHITFKYGMTSVYGVSGTMYDADGNEKYSYFPNLETVEIPSTVESLEGYGFFGQEALKTVVMQEGLLEIGDNAFQDCTALTSADLPSTVEYIGSAAFYNCGSLTGMSSLPASIEYVGSSAFYGCRSLNMQVKHPNNTLENQYTLSGITSLTLPADIRSVNPGGLVGCTSLKSISINGNNPYGYFTKDGVLYYQYAEDDEYYSGVNMMKYPAGKSNGGSYSVSDFVTYLGGFAFDSCSFNEIHLPVNLENHLAYYYFRSDSDQYQGSFDNMAKHCTVYYYDNPDAGYYYSFSRDMYPGYTLGKDGSRIRHDWVIERVPVSSLTLDIVSSEFYLGGSLDVEVNIEPAYAYPRDVVWTSSNKSAATVADGTITAVGIGNAVITAKVGSVSAKCNVRVLFSDVTNPKDFYYNYVYDMAGRGVVQGYDDGTFRPYKECNRAAVVTFLWRLMGKPSTKKKASFTDLTGNTDFDNAISWASEKGITTGWNDNTFRPWNSCNRAAVVTFLWRAAGRPKANKKASFSDMTGNSDFDNAISWAAENGITTGWDDNTFRPWNTCNRLAIVSFLARYDALKK